MNQEGGLNDVIRHLERAQSLFNSKDFVEACKDINRGATMIVKPLLQVLDLPHTTEGDSLEDTYHLLAESLRSQNPQVMSLYGVWCGSYTISRGLLLGAEPSLPTSVAGFLSAFQGLLKLVDSRYLVKQPSKSALSKNKTFKGSSVFSK